MRETSKTWALSALLAVVGLLVAASLVSPLGFGGSSAKADPGGGILYAGTDTEEFAGAPLPDRMAAMITDGALITASNIVDTDVYVNGLADSGQGTLFSGNVFTNEHNEINTDGSLIDSVAGPLPVGVCCNEDLAFDGTHVWRPYWPNGPIFQYDPDTGALVDTHPQADVVGAEFVESTLWISKWAARQVGTFDPVTDTFTPMFATTTNAGGLAYDPNNNILWVGRQGGWVEAWDLATLTLIAGSEFQPFGAIPDTIDGLAFVPFAENASFDVADPDFGLFDIVTNPCVIIMVTNVTDDDPATLTVTELTGDVESLGAGGTSLEVVLDTGTFTPDAPVSLPPGVPVDTEFCFDPATDLHPDTREVRVTITVVADGVTHTVREGFQITDLD